LQGTLIAGALGGIAVFPLRNVQLLASCARSLQGIQQSASGLNLLGGLMHAVEHLQAIRDKLVDIEVRMEFLLADGVDCSTKLADIIVEYDHARESGNLMKPMIRYMRLQAIWSTARWRLQECNSHEAWKLVVESAIRKLESRMPDKFGGALEVLHLQCSSCKGNLPRAGPKTLLMQGSCSLDFPTHPPLQRRTLPILLGSCRGKFF
jgi:hypothetical protein